MSTDMIVFGVSQVKTWALSADVSRPKSVFRRFLFQYLQGRLALQKKRKVSLISVLTVGPTWGISARLHVRVCMHNARNKTAMKRRYGCYCTTYQSVEVKMGHWTTEVPQVWEIAEQFCKHRAIYLVVLCGQINNLLIAGKIPKIPYWPTAFYHSGFTNP